MPLGSDQPIWLKIKWVLTIDHIIDIIMNLSIPSFKKIEGVF